MVQAMLSAYQLLTLGLLVAFPTITVLLNTKIDDLENRSELHGSYPIERVSSTDTGVTVLSSEIAVSLLDSQHSRATSVGFSLPDGTRDGQRKIISTDYASTETIVQTNRGAKLLTASAQHASLIWDHQLCRWHNTHTSGSGPAWVPLETRSFLPAAFVAALPTVISADGLVIESSENGRFVAVAQPDHHKVTVFTRSSTNCGQLVQLQVIHATDLTGAFLKNETRSRFGTSLKFDGSGTLLAIALPGDHLDGDATVPMGAAYVFEYSETTHLFSQTFDRVYHTEIEDTTTVTDARVLGVSNDGRGLLLGFPGYLMGRAALFQQNGTHWNLVQANVGAWEDSRFGECGGINRDGSLFVVGAPGSNNSDTPLLKGGGIFTYRGIHSDSGITALVWAPSAYAFTGANFGTTCGMDITGNVIWGGENMFNGTSRIHVYKHVPTDTGEYVYDFTFPKLISEVDNGPLVAEINPTANFIAVRNRNSTLGGFQVDVVDLEDYRHLYRLAPPDSATSVYKEAYGRHLSLAENGRVLWLGSGTNIDLNYADTDFTSGKVTSLAIVAQTGTPNQHVLVAGETRTQVANVATQTSVNTVVGSAGTAGAVATSYLIAAGDVKVIWGARGTGTNNLRVGATTGPAEWQYPIPAETVAPGLIVGTPDTASARAVGLVNDGSNNFVWVCHDQDACIVYNAANGAVIIFKPLLVAGPVADADQATTGSSLVVVVGNASEYTVLDAAADAVIEQNGTLSVDDLPGMVATSVQWKEDVSGFYVSYHREGVADYIRRYDYPNVSAYSDLFVLEEDTCLQMRLSPDETKLACASAKATAPVISTTEVLNTFSVTHTFTVNYFTVSEEPVVGWSPDSKVVLHAGSTGLVQSLFLEDMPPVHSAIFS